MAQNTDPSTWPTVKISGRSENPAEAMNQA
jgi:hypothetical protein